MENAKQMRENTYNNQKVCMGSREDGDIHRYPHRVRFVEPNSKIPLSTQEKQDKDSYVHQPNPSWKEDWIVFIHDA